MQPDALMDNVVLSAGCPQKYRRRCLLLFALAFSMILAWLRFPLKLIVSLSRHIQEVRFNFDVGHSMSALAKEMITGAGESPLRHRDIWWRGRDDAAGENCTDLFRKKLEESCEKQYERSCPN
jgi:hypothetical protein